MFSVSLKTGHNDNNIIVSILTSSLATTTREGAVASVPIVYIVLSMRTLLGTMNSPGKSAATSCPQKYPIVSDYLLNV